MLDTDLNLMWLQDASLGGIFMTGYDAITWAETLEYAGYDDWRLPNTDYYCTEFYCTNSEMGHLYYIEEVTSSDPGLFDNVQSTWYWSRTEWSESEGVHWIFNFDNGYQFAFDTEAFYAWAVRDVGEITVNIDIKPGSEPNSINLSSGGVIPVAILSRDSFDATTINPETVSLAEARVKMVGKRGKYLCHEEDVDDDGLLDLVCQVNTAQFVVETDESFAVLEAETFDGALIYGEDTVLIVPDN
ncbi:MAG: DUF1566 domain-containing protein [Thermodesulfovibrionia bacterium]|nr:DUF1566 domain-containing protein [Thermodesulfovibrionia bacterium]